jgi:hypothetical protein
MTHLQEHKYGAGDPSPLYACDVTADGRVLDWMAFDPEYGPESQAQIDWHRGEHGEAFVRGWKVGLPLPGCKSDPARRQRERFDRALAELPAELVEEPGKPKSAALQRGVSRNGRGVMTSDPRRARVTDICPQCGAPLPTTRGGRKRRAETRYCSAACRQRAYRERQVALFEEMT